MKNNYIYDDPTGMVSEDELIQLSEDVDVSGGTTSWLASLTFAVVTFLACPTTVCTLSCPK